MEWMTSPPEVVDVHNHVFLQEFFDFVNHETQLSVPVREDHVQTRYKVWAGLTNVDERAAMVDASRIDRQIVSFSAIDNFINPKHWTTNPEVRAEIAYIINNTFATMTSDYPDLFGAFADVPLVDGHHLSLAIDEIERAVDELGLDGVTLNSNYNGLRLDHEDLRPLLETIDNLAVPIFMHPSNPGGLGPTDSMPLLSPTIGFPAETTLSATRLVASGRLDEFDLNIIAPHMGGTIPYLAYRIERKEPGARDYFRNNFYYDTALYSHHHTSFALEEIGDQIVFGTDYPYLPTEDFAHIFDFIDGLDIPDETRDAIYGGNINQLCEKIDPG